jgi:pimeloyl-ACP methyl ester carboxylesterase
MAALLKTLGIENAVISGLSLGGYMSLAFHLKFPEKVRALMLFDTGPGYKNAEARNAWNERAEQWAANFEAEGLDALASMGSDEMRKDWHRSPQGLAGAARGMLAQVDSRVIESLSSIQVPALVLVGENDTPFIGATDYMVHKIPNSTHAVIPDAGHAANLHQPEAFNDAMGAFLEGLG